MKRAWIIGAIVLALFGSCLVALYSGKAYAQPRMALSLPSPFTESATYVIDPLHSSVSFEIRHLGIAKVHGRINKFEGKIVEDPRDLTKASVKFSAEAASIDTGVAQRDEHLRTADFFDVAKFPAITFESARIVRRWRGYTLTGDLTIKGRTKRVSINFQHYGPLKLEGMGDEPERIGVIAEPVTIKRSDFGVGSTDKLPGGVEGVSDEVTIRISLEAIREK